MKNPIPYRSLLLLLSCMLSLSAQIVRDGHTVRREGMQYSDRSTHSTQSSHSGSPNKVQFDTNTYLPLDRVRDDMLVNTDCGNSGSPQCYPDIAADGQGKHLTVWIDERTGQRRVDGQLSDSGGAPIGGIIRISDRYNTWNSQPHITYNPVSEEYLVAWADNGSNIVVQRISRSGGKSGANVQITDRYIVNTNNPTIAVAPNGAMMVVWTSSGYDFNANPLYCRRLDREARGIGSSFTIMSPPTDNMNSYGWEKKIAGDSLGRFLVVWSSYVNNRSRIIVQAIDTTGRLIGVNTNISDPMDTINHYFPTVTGLSNGRFLVAWQKDGGDIAGRVVSIDHGIISAQISLSNKRKGWFMIGLTSDTRDRFVIAYSGYTSTSSAGGLVVLDKEGIVTDSNHTITEPYFESPWSYPNMTTIHDRVYFLTCFGYRKHDQDVVVQQFRMPILRSGTPVKLGDELCSTQQQDPVTAVNQYGESLIVWEDAKTGTFCLAGQLYHPDQTPAGGNFIINDTSRTDYATDATITVDNDGSFIVCYSAGSYSDRDLYVRRVLRTGEMQASSINITEQPYYWNAYKALVQPLNDERYIIVWFNLRSTTSYCYWQILGKDLRPSSARKTLLTSNSASRYWIFDIAMNSRNDILVLWSDCNNNYYVHANELKAMMFTSEGKSIGDTVRIHTITDSQWYMSGTCRLDDERNMFFAFSEFHLSRYQGALNFKRVYADRPAAMTSIDISSTNPKFQIVGFRNRKSFTAWYLDGAIRGILLDDDLKQLRTVQFRTYPMVYTSWEDIGPGFSAALSGDSIVLAYADVNDAERGYDIVRSVYTVHEFDFQKNIIMDSVTVEKVSMVYPNPNKGLVTVDYQIITPLYIDLSVYNVLGQRVATLVSGLERTGVHTATFNTKDLPSGVYFLYYKGYRTSTQKFIVTH